MKMGAQTGMKMYVADFSGKLKEAAAENNAVFIDTDRKMYDAFMEWQTEIIEKNGRKKEMEAAGAILRSIRRWHPWVFPA